MATWLHEPDALRTLADEGGPVGSWARLQRLARGLPSAWPTDRISAGPALALRLEGVDAAVGALEERALPALASAVLHLGIGPSDPATWRAALRDRLAGPCGVEVADALCAIGQLRRGDLGRVLANGRSSPTLPAWALATAAPAEVPGLATELAEGLRGDLADGGSATLASMVLLQGGHLGPAPDDPVDAAERGAALAGAEVGVALPKGSGRARAASLVEALSAGLSDPLTAFTLAIARLRKGPPVPTPLVMALAWRARFQPTGDALTDVRRGARGWAALGRAREAVRAGAELPASAAGPTEAALLAEGLRDERRATAAARLRDADPFEDGTDLCRFAAASVCPDIVVDLLDDGHRRDQGIALASLAPTEEVLARLLAARVPAHPGDRRNLAWALARTGAPEVLPALRAMVGHLEPRVVSDLGEQVRSIFGQEL